MENIKYYVLNDNHIEYLGVDVGLDVLQTAVGGYIESIRPIGMKKEGFLDWRQMFWHLAC